MIPDNPGSQKPADEIKENGDVYNELDVFDKTKEGSLAHYLSQIGDYRKNQGKIYDFVPTLSMIIWGFSSGLTSMRQISSHAKAYDKEHDGQFSEKLGFPPGRIPSHVTLSRVLQNVDRDDLLKALTDWEYSQSDQKSSQTAVDGKVILAAVQKAYGEKQSLSDDNVNDTQSSKETKS